MLRAWLGLGLRVRVSHSEPPQSVLEFEDRAARRARARARVRVRVKVKVRVRVRVRIRVSWNPRGMLRASYQAKCSPMASKVSAISSGAANHRSCVGVALRRSVYKVEAAWGMGMESLWRASLSYAWLRGRAAACGSPCASARLHKVAEVVVGVARQTTAQQPRTRVLVTARRRLYAAVGHLS